MSAGLRNRYPEEPPIGSVVHDGGRVSPYWRRDARGWESIGDDPRAPGDLSGLRITWEQLVGSRVGPLGVVHEVPTEPGYCFMSDQGAAFSYRTPAEGAEVFILTARGEVRLPERVVAISQPRKVKL